MAYEKFIKKVPGKKPADLMLYTLSTCGWCKKTKSLLGELGLEYRYVDVDLLPDKEKEEAHAAMSKFNKTGNFPTIVFNGKDCIVGFDEEKIRNLAKIGK